MTRRQDWSVAFGARRGRPADVATIRRFPIWGCSCTSLSGPLTSTSEAENQEERGMARVARVTMAGCALLALAACGRETGAAAQPSTSTTTVPASTSTVATSTTSAPTTTLSPDQRDDAEIRALHARFYRMLEATSASPASSDPEIVATTTGIERQRWEEVLQQLVETGEHYEGPTETTIIALRHIDADHAAVRECSADRSVLVAGDRSVVERSDGTRHQTEVRVVRTADGWRVEDWFVGGAVPCAG